MKKLFLAIVVITLAISNSSAQNTFPASDNVDIDTTSLCIAFEVINSPTYKIPATYSLTLKYSLILTNNY